METLKSVLLKGAKRFIGANTEVSRAIIYGRNVLLHYNFMLLINPQLFSAIIAVTKTLLKLYSTQ